MTLDRLQVVDVGGANVEALAPAGVGVHLQLQRVLERVARGRGLVVDDRERGRDAALLVEDHVGAAGDRDAVEVELERPLGLPDAVQVLLVLARVAR